MAEQMNVIVQQGKGTSAPNPSAPLLLLVKYCDKHTNNKRYEIVPTEDVSDIRCEQNSQGHDHDHDHDYAPQSECLMQNENLVRLKSRNGNPIALVMAISDKGNYLNEVRELLIKSLKSIPEADRNDSNISKRVLQPKVENNSTVKVICDPMATMCRGCVNVGLLAIEQRELQLTPLERAILSTPIKIRASYDMNRENNHTGRATQESVIKTNPNVEKAVPGMSGSSGLNLVAIAKPMMFDQQTQTVFSYIEDVAKDSTPEKRADDVMLRDFNVAVEETRELKAQLKNMKTEIAEMKAILLSLSDRLTYQPNRADFDTSIVCSTPSNIPQRPQCMNPPRILNGSHPPSFSQQVSTYETFEIEPVIGDVCNESNYSSYSTPGTSGQLNQHNDSNDSMAVDANKKRRRTYSGGNTKGARKSKRSRDFERFPEDDGNPNDIISIGDNGTTVHRGVIQGIDFGSHTHATRALLLAVFSRDILASHSLTGKPSPAFIESNKPVKKKLDELKVHDIVQYVMKRSNVEETAVRSSITTKCADENKMQRQRAEKALKARQQLEVENRQPEND